MNPEYLNAFRRDFVYAGFPSSNHPSLDLAYRSLTIEGMQERLETANSASSGLVALVPSTSPDAKISFDINMSHYKWRKM